MGGGGSQDSTVTNVTQVDPVTQAWRQNLMGAGAALYNQGHPAPYPNSRVVPFANQTQAGLDYLQSYAQQGVPNLQAANDANERALSGWNPAMPMAANAAQGGLSANPWSGAFSQYGEQQNPHLRSMFDQGAEMVGNAVNSNFMRAGRFGPNAAHTGAMTRELGNLWSNIAMPAYENERTRALQAQQTGAALFDAGQERTLQGVGLFGDLNNAANENAQRSMALMPSLYSLGLQPAQAMLDAGGIYEDLAGRYLQDDMSRYNQPYQDAWGHLNSYANLLTQMPDFSGSTSSSQGPAPNRALQGLGMATGLAGLFGPGSLFGGSAGIFGAAGLFSDRRLKRDVVPLGEDAKGLPWYSYAYHWDEPGVRRIGVMADEAPPHAVSVHSSGYLMVNYAAL